MNRLLSVVMIFTGFMLLPRGVKLIGCGPQTKHWWVMPVLWLAAVAMMWFAV